MSVTEKFTYLYRVQVHTSLPWQGWSSIQKLQKEKMTMSFFSPSTCKETKTFKDAKVKCAMINELCLTWNFPVHKRCLGLLGNYSCSGVINLGRAKVMIRLMIMQNIHVEKLHIAGKSSLTSIFLPSTIVPFSFSRARSASAALSKVTNPKPCMFVCLHY